MKTAEWIITVANTSIDGVAIYKANGTKDEIKKTLIKLALKDKACDSEMYEKGVETVDDIKDKGREMNAFSDYHDYHIDYTAIEMKKIPVIREEDIGRPIEEGFDNWLEGVVFYNH